MKPHPTNLLGGSYKMVCTCDLKCAKTNCPIHYPREYLADIAAIMKLRRKEPHWHEIWDAK